MYLLVNNHVLFTRYSFRVYFPFLLGFRFAVRITRFFLFCCSSDYITHDGDFGRLDPEERL